MSNDFLNDEFIKKALKNSIIQLRNTVPPSPVEDSASSSEAPPPAPEQEKDPANTDRASESDNPAGAKTSNAQEEAEAYKNPDQAETDKIQDLELASFRHKERLRGIEIGKLQEEIENQKAHNRNHNAIARGRKIDNRLRLQMASATFKFMQYWCSFVALIVFIYVAKKDGLIDPNVVIALLGTSTISIVGLVGFVVSGLFKANREGDKKE